MGEHNALALSFSDCVFHSPVSLRHIVLPDNQRGHTGGSSGGH